VTVASGNRGFSAFDANSTSIQVLADGTDSNTATVALDYAAGSSKLRRTWQPGFLPARSKSGKGRGAIRS
jgi:archaellum component FlaG (FlaF/FlaG flagellin family)